MRNILMMTQKSEHYFIVIISFIYLSISEMSGQAAFDIYSFGIPDGYIVEETDQSLILSSPDHKLSILLLTSRQCTDIAYTEFGKDWAQYVTSEYSVLGFPNRTTSLFQGDWEMTTGQAKVFNDQVTMWIQLRNFTRQDKKATIIFFAEDDKQQETIKSFINDLKLNDINASSELPSKLNRPDNTAQNIQKEEVKADTKYYGNFIYKIPAGWKSAESQQFLELFPERVAEKEVFSIILLKGKTSSASLKEELAIVWDEFATMMRAEKYREVSGGNYNEEGISKTAAGWEYISGHGSIRTSDNFFVHAYIIRVNDKIERVIVLAREIGLDAVNNNIDPTVHHYPHYLTITDFIFNLGFVNLPGKDLPKPSFRGTGVLGVWAGIGFMGGQLKSTYIIFFNNGQVYYGSRFPLDGLYDLDTYADKERVSRYWGNYIFMDGKGTVTMPSGSFPIRVEGDKLILKPISEEHKYVRIPDVNDIVLDGRWMIMGVNDLPFTITFKKDGTFLDEGALKVLDHTLYLYYSIADGGGTGKYIVKDHTIIFNYNDGRVLTISFPGIGFTPGDQSPEKLILSFNEDILVKQ